MSPCKQPIPGQDGQAGGIGAMPGMPNDMMQLFKQFGGGEQGGGPFAFRQFGPGVVVNGMPLGGAAIPNGVSVTVQRQSNEPAHVTVKRGNETWEVVGDDANPSSNCRKTCSPSSARCSVNPKVSATSICPSLRRECRA